MTEAITIPLSVWRALIRMARAGTELEAMTPKEILAYCDECAALLEACRLARSASQEEQHT